MQSSKRCPFCGEYHRVEEMRSLVGFEPDGQKIWGEPFGMVIMDCYDQQLIPFKLWQERPIEEEFSEQLAQAQRRLATALHIQADDRVDFDLTVLDQLFELREALAWYGDQNHYLPIDDLIDCRLILIDLGERARKILEKYENRG